MTTEIWKVGHQYAGYILDSLSSNVSEKSLIHYSRSLLNYDDFRFWRNPGKCMFIPLFPWHQSFTFQPGFFYIQTVIQWFSKSEVACQTERERANQLCLDQTQTYKHLIRLPTVQANTERAQKSGTRNYSTTMLSIGCAFADMHEGFWIKNGLLQLRMCVLKQ